METRSYMERPAIEALFQRQLAFAEKTRESSARDRIRLLKELERSLLSNRKRLQDALYADFGKPPQEVDLVDIYYVLREIRYVTAHLSEWMRPARVPTPLAFIGSRATQFYEGKGASLIISPWNYPINLTLTPLVSSIAAGCTAILKPSEFVPHASCLMQEMLGEIFPEEHVALVEGEKEAAEALLDLPFHHIFFTGSPAIGKKVMTAAARHLTSVTLELGGKCPAWVDKSADLQHTARRLVQTKFANAGQTCIAPDYVLADARIADTLVKTLASEIKACYPDATHLEREYAGIIHTRHRESLDVMLADAVQKGATVLRPAGENTGERMAPVVLTGVNREMAVMQEEIFGPILPVITFTDPEEAFALVNALERPLASYVFAKCGRASDILRRIPSGGSCVNHAALHFYNPDLAFGGLNESGIGKSHGFAGFEAFSNSRAVYRQLWKYSPINWLHPPYKGKQWLIDLALRWL